MYMKDKNHSVTIRLNDVQFSFLSDVCNRLDLSLSQYLRMIVNMSVVKPEFERLKEVSHYENN